MAHEIAAAGDNAGWTRPRRALVAWVSHRRRDSENALTRGERRFRALVEQLERRHRPLGQGYRWAPPRAVADVDEWRRRPPTAPVLGRSFVRPEVGAVGRAVPSLGASAAMGPKAS